MKIRKNDTVLVIVGKDRGKQGKVREVLPEAKRVVVEGANMVKRHVKARGTVRQAGIIEQEAPVDISNVMLMCPKCHKPARVGSRFLSDGSKVRLCRSCGEVVD